MLIHLQSSLSFHSLGSVLPTSEAPDSHVLYETTILTIVSMSKFSLLLNLPPELLQKALLWTLVIDPGAELPLLRTSHYLHDSMKPVVKKSAEEYAKIHHGEVAAAVFSAAPNQNPLHEWLPQLARVTGRINSVLNHSRTKVDRYRQAEQQQRLATAPPLPDLDVNSCMSTLKLGLYLLEAMHHHRQSSPIDVRKALALLSTYGLLVVRMTSIVVAFAFLDDMAIDSQFVVRVVETQLTSFGCQDFMDIIRPLVFHPPCTIMFRVHGRRGLTCEHQDVREANAKIEATRRAAAYQFNSTLKLVGMPHQVLKTDLISTRIQESLEESEPILADGMNDVLKLQFLMAAEVGEKSEIEIMKEIEAVIRVWKA